MNFYILFQLAFLYATGHQLCVNFQQILFLYLSISLIEAVLFILELLPADGAVLVLPMSYNLEMHKK